MMKPELGYYLAPAGPLGELVIPIYGLRAIPDHIAKRLPKGYSRQNWQVQIRHVSGYVWINQSRHLIFLH